MVDPDAPTGPDGANKEGRIITADLKRRDFYHWDAAKTLGIKWWRRYGALTAWT